MNRLETSPGTTIHATDIIGRMIAASVAGAAAIYDVASSQFRRPRPYRLDHRLLRDIGAAAGDEEFAAFEVRLPAFARDALAEGGLSADTFLGWMRRDCHRRDP